MKLLSISPSGFCVPAPQRCNGRIAGYWAITHGQIGPRSWTVRFPFPATKFPVSGPPPPMEAHYDLIPTGRFDQRGHARFKLVPGGPIETGGTLVFWSLGHCPEWHMTGGAELIALGEELPRANPDGLVTQCPVVMVSGPCTLWWWSKDPTGERFTASFDGDEWKMARTHATAKAS